ncbi:TerC family protein [Peredibacter starrii]|uniref:TerC family protein n=1 Tax=Peredibacter starrii TaxID=28202 RepID=A0AAX4HN51_9BACT|nr:TerC family protein [Peredibacter starrii]WPU64747.1 TerC family protein [Peredibacter starrii]
MIELSAANLTSLVTLTAMETVLGIDNIIFIAILVAKLPQESQNKIRNLGIGLALIIRVLLLFSISWIMTLTEPLFAVMDHSFSGRDLILLGGGLFLIGKSTFEIHHKVEGDPQVHLHEAEKNVKKKVSPGMMLLQILILDIVFSLDSVITAVGMANQISIMVIAMVISMIIMLASAGQISSFVDKHPTIKILALAFLLLIGVMLVAEGMGAHVSKGYIYFAMAFSLAVELLNMRYRKKHV